MFMPLKRKKYLGFVISYRENNKVHRTTGQYVGFDNFHDIVQHRIRDTGCGYFTLKQISLFSVNVRIILVKMLQKRSICVTYYVLCGASGQW